MISGVTTALCLSPPHLRLQSSFRPPLRSLMSYADGDQASSNLLANKGLTAYKRE